MHLSLILLAIGIVYCTRWLWFHQIPSLFAPTPVSPPSRQWHFVLLALIFPPLLLLMTAIAVLYMGTQGQMWGLPVGWIGYSLAAGFLGYTAITLLWAIIQAWRSVHHLQTHPQQSLNGLTGRVLAHSTPFAAQVGFWRSELIVSQGLLDRLSQEQLESVLTHEQAHAHYHDTFWFFWLGWLRQITVWLPHTGSLWQELLLLRELRADRWAAQQVDPLVLAESLLLVVQAPLLDSPDICAAFGADPTLNRLEERIDALLTEMDAAEVDAIDSRPPYIWTALLLTLTPFLTVLFHT